MKKKKIPLRKCISCGQKKPKKELVRIVKNKEKGVIVDLTGKANGRGAYICNNLDCLNKAIKNGKISKILECDISEKIVEELKDIISQKNQ